MKKEMFKIAYCDICSTELAVPESLNDAVYCEECSKAISEKIEALRYAYPEREPQGNRVQRIKILDEETLDELVHLGFNSHITQKLENIRKRLKTPHQYGEHLYLVKKGDDDWHQWDIVTAYYNLTDVANFINRGDYESITGGGLTYTEKIDKWSKNKEKISFENF